MKEVKEIFAYIINVIYIFIMGSILVGGIKTL